MLCWMEKRQTSGEGILMAEHKIIIKAKLKSKLTNLLPLFSSLGYNKVEYKKEKIVIEKLTKDLHGENAIDYGIIMKKDSIEFYYLLNDGTGRRKRIFEMSQILMDILTVIGNYYLVEPTSIAKNINSTLRDIGGNMDKDVLEVNAQLEESKEKHEELKKRYEDLVRSSEENARILLECERRRDELYSRVQELEKLSDEALIQELYQWIKLHGGSIDTAEFCRSYNLPVQRVEEGLEILVKEKFIRRKIE